MELYVKNNNAKITLLYIHGYNSSKESINGIMNLEWNFNLVYFDYPKDKIYNAQELAMEIDKVIKKIKGKVVIMGHSLGGAVMAHLKDKFKIKKYIFLSALSPIMENNKGIKFLSEESKGKSAIKKILAKSLKMIGHDKIAMFVNPPEQWKRFAKENILNANYLGSKLKKAYIDKAKKSISIIGSNDHLFQYQKYNNFMTKNNIKNYTISKGSHNTMTDYPLKTLSILNSEIEFKKRWRKEILKK